MSNFSVKEFFNIGYLSFFILVSNLRLYQIPLWQKFIYFLSKETTKISHQLNKYCFFSFSFSIISAEATHNLLHIQKMSHISVFWEDFYQSSTSKLCYWGWWKTRRKDNIIWQLVTKRMLDFLLHFLWILVRLRIRVFTTKDILSRKMY